jgi:hypothetical protein
LDDRPAREIEELRERVDRAERERDQAQREHGWLTPPRVDRGKNRQSGHGEDGEDLGSAPRGTI